MTMTAGYQDASFDDDPVKDSKTIRRQVIVPLMRDLNEIIRKLEESLGVTPADYDDDGRRGD